MFGGKVLFVKQSTPLTIVSQNPTLENKALEPIVKGGMPFLVANVAVFFPFEHQKSGSFLFQKQVCMQISSSTHLLWNGKTIKSRSSEMNTFSRKPTPPKK